MGKRSEFSKIEKDKYPTPYKAVLPLLDFLEPKTRFIEPCANDGRLIRHLIRHGHICVSAIDIAPSHPQVEKRDALRTYWRDPRMFISNLPWTRPVMHALIRHLAVQAPLWTIIDSDWMHTIQAAELMPICRKIVSIGRVAWIEESDTTGKDNSCWYLFDGTKPPMTTEFHGRGGINAVGTW